MQSHCRNEGRALYLWLGHCNEGPPSGLAHSHCINLNWVASSPPEQGEFRVYRGQQLQPHLTTEDLHLPLTCGTERIECSLGCIDGDVCLVSVVQGGGGQRHTSLDGWMALGHRVRCQMVVCGAMPAFAGGVHVRGLGAVWTIHRSRSMCPSLQCIRVMATIVPCNRSSHLRASHSHSCHRVRVGQDQ